MIYRLLLTGLCSLSLGIVYADSPLTPSNASNSQLEQKSTLNVDKSKSNKDMQKPDESPKVDVTPTPEGENPDKTGSELKEQHDMQKDQQMKDHPQNPEYQSGGTPGAEMPK